VYQLEKPFFVMATQNPIEQEGTYPLPEAQMDRFLIHVRIDYPSDQDEIKVVRLVRSEQATPAGSQSAETRDGGSVSSPEAAADAGKIPQQAVFDARAEIDKVKTAEAVETYMVALIAATRRPAEFGDSLKKWISIGASPRGSLALDRCSRTYAWLQGRDFVSPEDVKAVVHDCLRHRLALSYEAAADGIKADQVLDELLKQVAVAA
jgi:MoxR-like ATPase